MHETCQIIKLLPSSVRRKDHSSRSYSEVFLWMNFKYLSLGDVNRKIDITRSAASGCDNVASSLARHPSYPQKSVMSLPTSVLPSKLPKSSSKEVTRWVASERDDVACSLADKAPSKCSRPSEAYHMNTLSRSNRRKSKAWAILSKRLSLNI
jgi:hypothetical protein